MIGAALLSASLFAVAAAATQGVEHAAGEAQLTKWSTFVSQGKFVDAARMMKSDPTFRFRDPKRYVTLEKSDFLRYIVTCRAEWKGGAAMNFSVPGKPATWNYNLLCPKLQGRVAASAAQTESTQFFISSTGDGIRVY